MRIFLFSLLLCLAAPAADYTLPAANQGQWTPGTHVGVVGGIDQYRAGGASARTNIIDVTQSPYNADNTGATNAAAAIQAALDASSEGDVIYLPAGTYKTTAGIGMYYSNRTLRGAGSDLTHIVYTGTQTAIGLGLAYDFGANEQTVTGTKTKGTTVLNVSSSAAYAVGQLARLKIENELDNTRIQAGAVPRISVVGFEDTLSPTVRVTAVGSGTITIDPPLPIDCTAYNTRIVNLISQPNYRSEKNGIEGLSIDGETGPAARGIYSYLGCENWFYDVAVAHILNYPIFLDASYKSEVTKCSAGDGPTGGPNGSAILVNTCTSTLIQNSHFYNFGPLNEENFASMNNAWLYNLFTEPVGNSLIVNHGPHNVLNLYEGNVARSYKSDGYYGSASNVTFYRNWFHASTDTGSEQHNAIIQNRMTREFATVGNVLGWDGNTHPNNSYGNPNIGNGYFDGDAEPSAGTFWRDWAITATLTTRTSDTEGVFTVSHIGGMTVGLGSVAAGNRGPSVWWSGGSRKFMEVSAISGLLVTLTQSGNGATGGDVLPAQGTTITSIWGGALVFQERDLDCLATAINVHNYEAAAVGTGAVTDSTADTLPNSLAYTSQPSWWTDDGFAGTWPPVNPNSPTFSLSIIPAGARMGAEPEPPAGGTITTGTLNVTTLNIGG